MSTGWIRATAALAIATSLLTACGSDGNETGGATSEELAEQLVEATQQAGILPNLTPEVVESLYGAAAPTVCDAFDGGLSTPAANLLRGNPGHGRRQTITTTALTYAGLVVQTYCPDVLPEFESAIQDIDPVEVDR